MRYKTFKGVLHNFLGTFTSRYSDYDGYWLFGLLVAEVEELDIDLLKPPLGGAVSPIVMAANEIAVQKFREQVQKARLSLSCVLEAKVSIRVLRELQQGVVNGRPRTGHNVEFVATVGLYTGQQQSGELCLFVAPHDSNVESRSTRGDTSKIGGQILLSYGSFYHATTEANWAKINVQGLKPTADGYEYTCYKGKPLICLSTPNMKYKWVKTLSDKNDGANILILEVPAKAIAERNFALDETSTELQLQREKLGTNDFKTLLDAVGDLVCFDTIPADLIRVHETRSPRQDQV